jgi:hypothetical protein
MDELSSTFEKTTLAKAGSLSLPPVEVPAAPKRTFAEFDNVEAQLLRAKRPCHDTMTMISAPCPPTLSKVAAMLTPKRSILERLPNEILSEIYLISHNTSLLRTCRTIQNALATDVLFKQLALAAFDRSDLCERHQERAELHKNCTFCQQGGKCEKYKQQHCCTEHGPRFRVRRIRRVQSLWPENTVPMLRPGEELQFALFRYSESGMRHAYPRKTEPSETNLAEPILSTAPSYSRRRCVCAKQGM